MLKKLIKKLRKRKSLSYARYQLELINLFMDECSRCKKKYKSKLDLFKIAHLTSIRFLDSLIKRK